MSLNVVYLVAFLDMFAASMIVTMLPVYLTTEVGLSATAAGVVGSVYGVVQFWSSPIIGGCSDIIGCRKTLLLCLTLCAVAYAVLAYELIWMLVFGRFLAGCFKHTQNQCKTVVSSFAKKKEKLAFFGRLNSMGNIAFMVAPAFAGKMAGYLGYWSVFAIISSVFLSNMILVYFCFPKDIKRSASATEAPSGVISLLYEVAILLDSGRFIVKQFFDKFQVNWTTQWDLMALRFLQSFLVLLYRSSADWQLVDRYHADPATLGYLTSLQAFAAFVSSAMVESVVRTVWRGRKVRGLTQSSALLTVSLTGMWLGSPTLAWYAFWLIGLNVASALLRVLSLDLTVARSEPIDYGIVIGASASVVASARAVAPALGGFTFDFQPDLPIAAATGIALTSFFIAATYTRANQKLYSLV